jgi:hypothetical protein
MPTYLVCVRGTLHAVIFNCYRGKSREYRIVYNFTLRKQGPIKGLDKLFQKRSVIVFKKSAKIKNQSFIR